MKGAEYLSEGLMREFEGVANQYGETTKEDGTVIKSAVVEAPGFRYTDEYISARVTSGEENLVAQDLSISRRYHGYTEDVDVLKPLGLTEAEVFEYLTRIIVEHGQETRLDSDFEIANGPWNYQYVVESASNGGDKVQGTERIFYNNVQVFIHHFEIEVKES